MMLNKSSEPSKIKLDPILQKIDDLLRGISDDKVGLQIGVADTPHAGQYVNMFSGMAFSTLILEDGIKQNPCYLALLNYIGEKNFNSIISIYQSQSTPNAVRFCIKIAPLYEIINAKKRLEKQTPQPQETSVTATTTTIQGSSPTFLANQEQQVTVETDKPKLEVEKNKNGEIGRKIAGGLLIVCGAILVGAGIVLAVGSVGTLSIIGVGIAAGGGAIATLGGGFIASNSGCATEIKGNDIFAPRKTPTNSLREGSSNLSTVVISINNENIPLITQNNTVQGQSNSI